MAPKHVALSLFWRTFVLIALLLACGVFAWTQTFRALEFEPRATQQAQQIASLAKLARAALQANFWPLRVMPEPHSEHFIKPERRRFGLRPNWAGCSLMAFCLSCTADQSASSRSLSSGTGSRSQSDSGLSRPERLAVSGCFLKERRL